MHPQPHPPHHRRRQPIRIWLQPFVIGLVIVSAFVSCYVGLMRDPQPHRIPVAVTGPQLANKVQQALGDSIHVRRADSTTEALDALRHRDIVAVLGTSPHGKDLKLDVASANGLSPRSPNSSPPTHTVPTSNSASPTSCRSTGMTPAAWPGSMCPSG
ncbi:hypothetical protein [Streptomyces sp. OV198]|uniref:hypothetical protein n=1 Tax=Streptomyces sp. OV198 TaxID=1882787 RepID=UPI000BE383D0|nr:hypothetical protein [Streptomyces sp. OV198]